ncbi:hypothetical protein Brsp07_04624 [Brucella sp. NBRC 14130]|uniref:DUF4326 domain-containing protein n=1 Tax=Brucella sp. NBRC 14130 TaxID=3075483 RepID=UPI0030B36B56
MAKVRHVREASRETTATQVYIGRPSKWGNPFVIGRDGDRDTVIAKYRRWIRTKPELMASLHELRGRDLVCFCAPQPCHGDVLLALVEELGERRDVDHSP